jgi:hypothetical protein
MTPVIFRCDRGKDGDVFALFPATSFDAEGFYCLCYQHVGQHGGADYSLCIRNSRPATPAEFKDLRAELISIGYLDLKVCRRETAAMRASRRGR